MWMDCRPLMEKLPRGTDPASFFLKQARVGLSDGRDFAGPGHLRLNFGKGSTSYIALARGCCVVTPVRATGVAVTRPLTGDARLRTPQAVVERYFRRHSREWKGQLNRSLNEKTKTLCCCRHLQLRGYQGPASLGKGPLSQQGIESVATSAGHFPSLPAPRRVSEESPQVKFVGGSASGSSSSSGKNSAIDRVCHA